MEEHSHASQADLGACGLGWPAPWVVGLPYPFPRYRDGAETPHWLLGVVPKAWWLASPLEHNLLGAFQSEPPYSKESSS